MFTKLKYNLYYLYFLLKDKKLKQDEINPIAKKFINFNNKIVLEKIKDKEIKKVLILLPHCLQKYTCPYKITSFIENCKRCNECVISDFLDIKKIYSVDVKIATGGTLARRHIMESKPNLVIAVACKRDLISGIMDAKPIDVIGVFNEFQSGPCVNTSVSIEEIKKYLKLINNKKGEA